MTIEELIGKLDTQLRDEFEKRFLEAVAQKTPVRTGALQQGWRWDNSDPKKPVFTNTQDYAAYVEFGTPTHTPQAMVGTTMLEATDILKDAVEAIGL